MRHKKYPDIKIIGNLIGRLVMKRPIAILGSKEIMY
jgi:hypothetical protein